MTNPLEMRTAELAAEILRLRRQLSRNSLASIQEDLDVCTAEWTRRDLGALPSDRHRGRRRPNPLSTAP